MTTELVNKVAGGNDLDKDDLALLQTLPSVLASDPAPEPGDKIIERGEVPMIRTRTTSAGYINLRRNSDGKLVPINRNQLVDRLRQKLPNGEPAWLPPNAPWNGRVRTPKLLCPLNANHPDRPRMDALNLEVCEKRGRIMTPAGVRRHLTRKHKEAWEAIQVDEENRKEASRHEQALIMNQALLTALNGRDTQVASPARARRGGRPKRTEKLNTGEQSSD